MAAAGVCEQVNDRPLWRALRCRDGARKARRECSPFTLFADNLSKYASVVRALTRSRIEAIRQSDNRKIFIFAHVFINIEEEEEYIGTRTFYI